MGFKEGSSCACGLANWEGSCPHCSGSEEDFNQQLGAFLGPWSNNQVQAPGPEELKEIECEGCGKKVPVYTVRRNSDNQVLGECCRPAILDF